MKNTLYLSILAAALMGGQVFADYIPTATDADKVDDGFYAGKHSETGDVSSANVTINEEEEGGEDFSQSGVYGGFTGGEQTSAINNSVTMTGGQVAAVKGGQSWSGSANNNIVTISGGRINDVCGGYSGGTTNGNTVTITGGRVTNELCGGFGSDTANGNTVTILSGQVDMYVYGGKSDFGTTDGNTVVLSSCVVDACIFAGYTSGTSTNNAIELYGTGISCWCMDYMQLLNFHLADGVLLSQKAMVSLTSNYSEDALNLKGVELGLYGDDVKDWSAFDGKSITLVSAKKAIKNATGSLGDVEIKGKDGELLATASLALANSSKSLVLSNIKGATPVPEPTSGTLSLLALCALAARRRRK